MAGMGADRPARTSSRKAGSAASIVSGKPQPRKLPARRRRKEIAIGCPAVTTRRGAAGALQHELPAHELAVVLADRALGGLEAGEAEIGARRPFPHVAKNAAARSRHDRVRVVQLI